MTQAQTPHETLCWLRLSRTENVGPATFRRLLQRYGSAENALAALPELAKRGGKTKPLIAQSKDDALREVDRTLKLGARLLTMADADYPAYLSEIDDAPPVITVMGNVALFKKPALGVVGARNASLAGRKIAADFSAKTGASGYVVVSGLARGIDAAAHQAALATGTIAVVAGGIDVVYPPEHKDLTRLIASQGLIVAESPFGTEPLARHFPKRNRIISGLSLGVLVVEAALKSGSLITARMALEQNREVFAVPGSPLDPRAEGTNSLLRDGAHMAASANDIVNVLRTLRLKPVRETQSDWHASSAALDMAGAPEPSPDLHIRILEILSPVPVQIDELIRAVCAPASDVLTVILELELAGRIERQLGNKVNLM